MSATVGGFIGALSSFFDAYILPYLPTLLILLAAVAFATWLGSWNHVRGQKRALGAELALNLKQASAILEFVDSQKVGASYITPIPRFYTSAYEEMLKSGNLGSLRPGVREETGRLYSQIRRVDDASNRQEELLAGVPGTSPVASELRAENLTYIRDTISNVILPKLEQLGAFLGR